MIFWAPEQWNPVLKGLKLKLHNNSKTTHGQFRLVSSVSVLTPGLKAAKSSERAPVRALVSAAFSDCLAIDWTGSVSGSHVHREL